MTVETRYEGKTDGDDIPLLPKSLDQKIRLNKDAEALGLQVEIEEGGLNGMIVRSLTKDGTIARDGKIQPEDYLVAVQFTVYSYSLYDKHFNCEIVRLISQHHLNLI